MSKSLLSRMPNTCKGELPTTQISSLSIFYNPVYDGVRFSKNVSSHNEYANFYGKPIKDIIYNPENHFYIHGIKMITLEGMIDMKNRRSEQKDINDVRMALTYLSGN